MSTPVGIVEKEENRNLSSIIWKLERRIILLQDALKPFARRAWSTEDILQARDILRESGK